MTKKGSLFSAITRAFRPGAPEELPPTEFVTQVLEPTGGTILRPKDWYYLEQHRGPTCLWTISREQISATQDYTTGVRIQFFIGVKNGTGKTTEQFIRDVFTNKQRPPAKIVSTRPAMDQGLFSRIGLETEEGPFHILYSLFWGNGNLDMAVINIAGTKKELWDTYSPTFDKMNDFELIDPKRFDKTTPLVPPIT